MKKAIGLVYAIFVLVIISTILVYVLELSSFMPKVTADEYIKNQLKLYRNSAIEYALLWVSADKQRSQNTSELNITFEDNFKFSLKIKPTNLSHIKESNGTILIDLIGMYEIANNKMYVITHRTVQKP